MTGPFYYLDFFPTAVLSLAGWGVYITGTPYFKNFSAFSYSLPCNVSLVLLTVSATFPRQRLRKLAAGSPPTFDPARNPADFPPTTTPLLDGGSYLLPCATPERLVIVPLFGTLGFACLSIDLPAPQAVQVPLLTRKSRVLFFKYRGQQPSQKFTIVRIAEGDAERR